MNNQLAPEEILKHFEENADYQWLCTNISLLSESIRKDYHIDSLLYYVDSLREALLANSSELKYYRHFECYAEILHTISSKVQLQLYGPTTLEEQTTFEEQTSFELQTNPAPKKRKTATVFLKKLFPMKKYNVYMLMLLRILTPCKWTFLILFRLIHAHLNTGKSTS